MDGIQVKQELLEHFKFLEPKQRPEPPNSVSVIYLSGSDSDCDDSSSSSDNVLLINGKRPRVSSGSSGEAFKKKKTMEELGAALPVGFLDPLPPKKNAPLPLPSSAPPGFESRTMVNATTNVDSCKQFWKAGDYEGRPGVDWGASSGGMDHVRVHPKFLHSNATSHKWVLGAFAELLDNSLDEVCNGATFVSIDMLKNKKDGSRMLLIEDNGGGMDPDKIRRCMSLGYSAKSKIADTIGQYGNGFKTSTMRLGADVIVFSRCFGEVGKRPTQSIGLLSYTFLRSTGKEDIVVPMLDYERRDSKCNRMIRSSTCDWDRNLETILQWSPFSSEADLLQQFNRMEDHGTRIIIYNLWEDDHGQLELDFDTDPYDIQIRGVNRDEKSIQMAKQFPNSKHFLTYRHSLRSYASILYLRIPQFRIILRGKDVVHHNIVNDMMMTQEITYRPQTGTNRILRDSHMVATVTIGFVKDAKAHIDVQGFNVYHKNRLIKPFWRVWNAAGSGGRGVIGVLEANFVEPAHDKQGFERTIVLSRLETKLVQMQKTYWSTYCHKIGYAPCRNKQIVEQEPSPDYLPQTPSQSKKKNAGSSTKAHSSVSDKVHSLSNQMPGRRVSKRLTKTGEKSQIHRHVYIKGEGVAKNPAKRGKGLTSPEQASTSEEDHGCHEARTSPKREEYVVNGNEVSYSISNSDELNQLQEENRQLRERLERQEQEILGDLLLDLQNERERHKLLELKLEEATRKIEELNKEQESLIDIFSEERERRDAEEENLRNKLKNASKTIQELLDKVVLLEKMKSA